MITQRIQSVLREALIVLRSEGLSVPEDVDVSLEIPSDSSHGDYTTNLCLRLSKDLGVQPRVLAEKLVAAIKNTKSAQDGLFENVEVAGPGFVNFTLSQKTLVESVSGILAKGDDFGLTDEQSGKKAVVEFFQPNIAKPLHVGHLRSAVIGHACLGLVKSQGYETITDTHYGDWGVQFGILLNAFLRLPDEDRESILTDEYPVDKLNEIYVAENTRIAKNEDLRNEGKETFAKLEEGDKELREYWQRFVDVSLKTYPPVLDWLGVPKFDVEFGESFYEDRMPGDLEVAINAGAVKEDEAVYFDLDDVKLGRCFLVKSDGSTTYHLRDISTFLHRKEEWNPDLNLYFVGDEQSHHFRQLFEVLKRMGHEDLIAKSEHVQIGQMTSSEGKFSTRKGNIIRVTELFEEAEKRITEVMKEKNPDLPNMEEAAHKVAVAVIKWWDLSQDHRTKLVFDWDKALSFDGNTGPYMQYSIARFSSILRKAEVSEVSKMPQDVELDEQDVMLLRKLLPYSEVVRASAERREPHHLCAYLFELAQQANQFYANVHVLNEEDKNVQKARLALVSAVRQVLSNGLTVLGIPVVEEM